MVRLDEGVYAWSWFDRERRLNFNGFLLGDIVVDPPPLSADDAAYLETVPVKPREVVITNRNHLRDSARWRLPVALHEAEAGQVGDFKPERLLREGDAVGPGLEVVHLPGKSPGEIGLLWRERRLLLLGDALIAPHGRLKTVPEAKIDDLAALKRSIKKLAALDFETLLLADGDPILRGGRAAVVAFAGTL